MTFVRRELAGTRDLLPLAAARPERYPCLLESAVRGAQRARHDILFAFPPADQLPPDLPDTKFVFGGEMAQLLRQAEAVTRDPTP